MTTTTLTTTVAPAQAGGSTGAETAGLRTVRIALAGCGTVGGDLVRLLDTRGGAVAQGHGVRFELTAVLVRDPRKPRPSALPPDRLTTDLDAFLAADADVVVEAIGGLEPAGRIATAALERGLVLVTANKALVAAYGTSLDRLARERGGRLLFEAAVAGGVPVIATLREALAQTGVRRVRGILNGTTNYVLDRMTGGVPFAAALVEARDRGYAEADASRDLDGRDAADKLGILAWIAFGADPATLRVHRRGLLPRPDRLVADADAFGGVARLLAECGDAGAESGGITAAVEPAVLAPDSPHARTAGADNLVEVETDHSGTIRLSGPGAGGAPTASAVLSDLLRAAAPGDGRPSGHAAWEPTGAAARASADGPTGAPPHPAWVISVRRNGGAALLAERLRETGIEPEDVLDDVAGGITRVRTGPCDRERVRELEAALERRGLEPAVSRWCR